MASIRISQLASVSAVTADDFLIVNDNDTNTRKISFSNFSSGLIKSTAATQTLTGNLTIAGTLAATDLAIDGSTLLVSSSTNRVGINVSGPSYALDVDGDVQIRAGKSLRFGDSTTAFAVTLQAPGTLTANSGYTLPTAQPSTNGQALVCTVAGAMDWASILTNPMTSAGQMIVQNASNAVAALDPGSESQVLTIQSNGIPGWSASQSGFSDPMQAAGDMIFKNVAGLTTRLPVGSVGQVLGVSNVGVPHWTTGATPAGSNGQVQYNASGALGASGSLSFDTSTLTLSAANLTTTGKLSATQVATNLIPDVTAAKTLGSASNRWSALYVSAGLNFLSQNGLKTGQLTFGNDVGYNFLGDPAGGGLAANLNIYNGNNANFIGITIPNTITGSYKLTLPPTAGSPGAILTTSGSGVLSWTDASTGTININTIEAQTLFSSGDLEVGNTAADPNFSVSTIGDVDTKGRYRSNRTTASDEAYLAAFNNATTFRVATEGTTTIGPNGEIVLDQSGAVTSTGEIASKQAGSVKAFSTYDNNVLTSRTNADGSHKIGGDIATGGNAAIGLNPNGVVQLNGDAGQSGQVLTSGGAGAQATWTTVSGGGGGTKGQKGEPGVGQKGEPGVKGVAGTNGNKGEKGAAGTNGTDGNDGSAGAKGDKGSDGASITGSKGQKGEVGEQGTKGIKGEGSGVFSFQGNVAEVGDLPATGNTNGDVYRVTNGGQLYVWDGTQWVQMGLGAVVKGEKGEQGQKGTTGDKGQKGTTGTNGTDGTKGEKGTTGTGQKGEPGVNGSNGNKGEKGIDGSKGQKGVTGAVTQTTPAGSNQQVQFNDNGAAGANANFNFTGVTLNTPGIIVSGNTTLGTGSSNSINLLGDVNSNITPSSDNVRTLGTSSARWKQLFVGTDIRFSTSLNTSQKIQKPFTQGASRGLAIGDVEIHTGTAGTGSIYVGKENGSTTGGQASDHNTIIGFEAGRGKPSNDNTLIGYNAGRNLEQIDGQRETADNVLIGSEVWATAFGFNCTETVQIGNNVAANAQNIKQSVLIGPKNELGSNFKTATGTVSINYGGTSTVPVTAQGSVLIGGGKVDGTYAPVHLAATMNNVIALGSTAIANAYVQVAWTVVSDERDKVLMGGVPHGLDFVSRLKPVTYQFKRNGDRHEIKGNGQDRYGFVAQDVLALEGEHPVIVDNIDEDKLKLTSDSLVPVLVNAIKELKAEVEKLKNA